jgi:hypothetical protein
MYYIGLDVHKKTISYCVKDAGGQIHRQAPSAPRATIFENGPSRNRDELFAIH